MNSKPKAREHTSGRFGVQPSGCTARGRLKPELRTDISADFAGRPMLFSGAQSDFLFESNWNRVVFGAPVTDITQVNFGSTSSTQINPRQIQFGMKLIF